MAGTRKIAAILVADIVGYSRLAGTDEDRTLSRLRGLRGDLIDPAIDAHRGRIVKRTGDGSLIEFRSVVDAVSCAIEVQSGMAERNAGLPSERRIEFRVGIHLGDVVEEADGDLMGDGVNIAARLEGIALPGAICLSEDAYRQVKGRLNLAVNDLGPTQLKNIAEPIRVYALQAGVTAEAKPTNEAKHPEKRLKPQRLKVLAALAVGFALFLILFAAWYFLAGNGPAHIASKAIVSAEAAHLSIVVLPFNNLSSDRSQDYFADGITENLTTELSRIPNSFVIARNTAFTYKGKALDAKAIGKELGVRYVLEGSVQRDQNRVRVNAQLIDAQSGAHLWADHFEEGVADLFRLQDQVVARLANSLGSELVIAEAEKSTHSKIPDAIDLAMRGWALTWQARQQPPRERESTLGTARSLFDEALKIDPNDADALAGDAYVYYVAYFNGWNTAEDYDTKVLGQADRAIMLVRDNMRAYLVKSNYLFVSSRANEALGAANAGLAINPNYAPLLAARSTAESSLGRFEQAKSDVQQAMRLSPRDPLIGQMHLQLGDAELGLGHLDAAIDEYHVAIDAGYRHFQTYSNLAAAYALDGKIDEAKTALAEAQRLNPKLTISWMIAHTPNLPPVFEGLRKAGLPEE
jgi:adenylate cyclase